MGFADRLKKQQQQTTGTLLDEVSFSRLFRLHPACMAANEMMEEAAIALAQELRGLSTHIPDLKLLKAGALPARPKHYGLLAASGGRVAFPKQFALSRGSQLMAGSHQAFAIYYAVGELQGQVRYACFSLPATHAPALHQSLLPAFYENRAITIKGHLLADGTGIGSRNKLEELFDLYAAAPDAMRVVLL